MRTAIVVRLARCKWVVLTSDASSNGIPVYRVTDDHARYSHQFDAIHCAQQINKSEDAKALKETVP